MGCVVLLCFLVVVVFVFELVCVVVLFGGSCWFVFGRFGELVFEFEIEWEEKFRIFGFVLVVLGLM